MARHNIYLAGFMGTGKTTVGRELARLMGRKFVDLDEELVRREGMSIHEIFEEKGEDYFRVREREVALEIAETDNRVVATGGGTLLDPEVFRAFESSGVMICLYTRREVLISRLARSDKRPLLKDGDVPEKVDSLLEQRRHLYDRIRIRVDTTILSPMEAARKIHDLLEKYRKALDLLQGQYIELS